MQQLRLTTFTLLLSFIAFQLQAQNWVNGGNSLSANGTLGTNSNHSLLFETNNIERGRITNGGNWGIGTNNPLKLLHVNGFGAFGNRVTSANATRALNLADVDAVMRVLRVHATFAPAVELISRTAADGANVAYWDFYAEPSDKSFRIRDRVGGGAGLDRVTISGTGNVGIGTTTPFGKLMVTDNTTGNPTAVVENLRNAPSTFNDGLYIVAGSSTGVGESWYTAFFTLDGRFNTPIGAITQADANSVIYGTTSDKRLKTNVQETRFGLADVNKIQVKDYHFYGSNKKQTGFLAQQLYEVFPEAVAKGGDDSKTRPWMVDYGRITPLLVKAVQELSLENDGLKKKTEEVDELKKEVAELKLLVSKLVNGQNTNTPISGGTLLQKAPNPVRSTTSIQDSLPEGSSTSQLLLTGALGRTVKSIQLTSTGVVNFDVSTLSSGVYNYSLVVDGRTLQTKKMTVRR